MAEAGVEDAGDHQRLVQKRQAAEKELGALDKASEAATRLDREAEEARTRVLAHRRELTRRRQAFIAALDASDQAELRLFGLGLDPEAAVKSFRAAIDKPTALNREICEAGYQKSVLPPLYDAQGLPAGEGDRQAELADRVEDLVQRLLSVAEGGSDPDIGGILTNHLRKLSPEQLDTLALWQPEDGLVVRYQASPGRWRSLKNGSAGQRSAAVLAFILSHGREPLILDQPEDDLDNHLIYRLVVKELERTKAARQVIVVTHNPNIVVNADAELVNSMRFADEQIHREDAASGSLQNAAVRAEVCEVMEGGEEAFQRRHQRLIGSKERTPS